MITASIPGMDDMQLISGAEYQLKTPPSASGIIVSPLQVKTSDGSVLLTWDDASSQVGTVPLANRILDGFVATAEKALARFPNNAPEHRNLGIAFLKRGNLNKAIESLERALAIDPSNELATTTLAEALLKNGHAADAEHLLLQLSERRRNDERVCLALANIAILQNEYEKARERVRAALVTHKDSARLHFMLGIVELNSGNIQKAVSALRKAAHLGVRNPMYHHTLGIAYALHKDYEKAEKALNAALSLSPLSLKTLRALGQVLIDKGEPYKAFRLLASRGDSNDIETRQLLARAYDESGRHNMAQSIVKGILQEQGTTLPIDRKVSLLNALAVSLMSDGKPEEAEISLRQAINIGPDVSSVPYENLGRLYIDYLEQPESAIGPLQRARNLFPRSQVTRVILAIALVSCGDDDAALNELLPFWRQGTAEEWTYACLGWLYEHLGNYSMSISILADGHSRFPRVLGIINNLAYTYLMSGDVESAKTVLSRVPRGAKRHLHLVATFGLLRLWEGDEKKGRELYEQAETMAAAEGHKNTAKRARQKKHLELARMFIRSGNRAQAARELRKGLAMRDFPLSFRKDLEQLSNEVGQTGLSN